MFVTQLCTDNTYNYIQYMYMLYVVIVVCMLCKSNGSLSTHIDTKRKLIMPTFQLFLKAKNGVGISSHVFFSIYLTYLEYIQDFTIRCTLAKLRVSAHNLQVETGRLETPRDT